MSEIFESSKVNGRHPPPDRAAAWGGLGAGSWTARGTGVLELLRVPVKGSFSSLTRSQSSRKAGRVLTAAEGQRHPSSHCRLPSGPQLGRGGPPNPRRAPKVLLPETPRCWAHRAGSPHSSGPTLLCCGGPTAGNASVRASRRLHRKERIHAPSVSVQHRTSQGRSFHRCSGPMGRLRAALRTPRKRPPRGR